MNTLLTRAVRGEVGVCMSKLGKIGIGGFPGYQEIGVPCRGCGNVTSLLADERYAVERKARARPLDERLFVSRLCTGPVRGGYQRRRLSLANRTNIGWRLAISERFFFLLGLYVKLLCVVVQVLRH